MLRSLLSVKTPDYDGLIFKGVVVANNDPLKLERVKIKIPGLYDDQDQSLYPWCISFKRMTFGNGSGFGEFGVPSLGAVVGVFLQQGDPHYPVYMGSPLQVGMTLAEAAVNYPNRYGFKDPAGNLFYVDMTSGDVKFAHNSGTEVLINDTVVKLTHNAGTEVLIDEDVFKVTHSTGTIIEIDASGNIIATGAGNGTVQVTGILTLQGSVTNIVGTTSLTLTTPSLGFAVTGTSTFTGGGSINMSGASSVALP